MAKHALGNIANINLVLAGANTLYWIALKKVTISMADYASNTIKKKRQNDESIGLFSIRITKCLTRWIETPQEIIYINLSFCLSLYLSFCICLSACLPVRLSNCLSVCLPISLYICLCACLSVHLYISLMAHLCVCVCVRVFVCLLVC